MSDHWDHENSTALEALQSGDVEPLITLLEETKRPLHTELRLWLAAMLKGDATSVKDYWLELKRHPGFPSTDASVFALRSIRIGKWIHALWNDGQDLTKAKASAEEEFGLGARTIDDIWAQYRSLYFQLEEEGISLSPGLRPLRPQLTKPSE